MYIIYIYIYYILYTIYYILYILYIIHYFLYIIYSIIYILYIMYCVLASNHATCHFLPVTAWGVWLPTCTTPQLQDDPGGRTIRTPTAATAAVTARTGAWSISTTRTTPTGMMNCIDCGSVFLGHGPLKDHISSSGKQGAPKIPGSFFLGCRCYPQVRSLTGGIDLVENWRFCTKWRLSRCQSSWGWRMPCCGRLGFLSRPIRKRSRRGLLPHAPGKLQPLHQSVW